MHARVQSQGKLVAKRWRISIQRLVQEELHSVPSAEKVASIAQRGKSYIQCLAQENLHPSPSAVTTTSVAKSEKSCILRQEQENFHPVLSVGKVVTEAKRGGTQGKEGLKACRPTSQY